MPPSGGATAARTADDGDDGEPGQDDRHAPEAVGQAARRSATAPNIPKVWPLMTSPTAARPWPWSVMWSGVIVMIRTMTTWPVTSATIATGTFGPARTVAMRDAGRRSRRPRRRGGTSRRRGRRGRVGGSANDRSAAAPTKTIGTRYAPAQRGQAEGGRRGRRRAPRGSGPTTAPNVAPQTTIPMADARRAAGYRSAAA